MNWRCRLIGHKGYDEYVSYPDPYVCERCGRCDRDDDFTDPRHAALWRHVRYRIWCRYWGLRAWLHPCRICGRRFGRHDAAIEHSPF